MSDAEAGTGERLRRETEKVIAEHIGMLQLREGTVWMCIRQEIGGMAWKPVFSAEQLRAAIERQAASEITQQEKEGWARQIADKAPIVLSALGERTLGAVKDQFQKDVLAILNDSERK